MPSSANAATFGREHIAAQHRATRIGQRIVGQIRKHAAVHEAILLQQLRRDEQRQLGATWREDVELGTELIEYLLQSSHARRGDGVV